jgi:hypothetical protein
MKPRGQPQQAEQPPRHSSEDPSQLQLSGPCLAVRRADPGCRSAPPSLVRAASDHVRFARGLRRTTQALPDAPPGPSGTPPPLPDHPPGSRRAARPLPDQPPGSPRKAPGFRKTLPGSRGATPGFDFRRPPRFRSSRTLIMRLLLLPMRVGRARNTIPPGTMRVPDHPTTDHRPPDSRPRSTVKTHVFSMRALRPRMRSPRL